MIDTDIVSQFLYDLYHRFMEPIPYLALADWLQDHGTREDFLRVTSGDERLTNEQIIEALTRAGRACVKERAGRADGSVAYLNAFDRAWRDEPPFIRCRCGNYQIGAPDDRPETEKQVPIYYGWWYCLEPLTLNVFHHPRDPYPKKSVHPPGTLYRPERCHKPLFRTDDGFIVLNPAGA